MTQERRGRPKEPELSLPSRKYTKVYEDEDTIETWTYNLDKFHGPISVDIKYKNGYDKNWGKMQREAKRVKKETRRIKKVADDKNVNLPKSMQTFINPKTGKTVSYQRAKQLKLTK
jgi:hypothetical protein